METLWFCLVAIMIAVYVLLDGFDLGAGTLHLRRCADGRRAPRKCSPRSVRSGTATKCGCWPRAARSISPFPLSTLQQLQRFLSSLDDGAVAA